MLRLWRRSTPSDSADARCESEAASNSALPLVTALTRSGARDMEHRLEQSRYYLGIDLGTTNSAVALADARALLDGDLERGIRVLPLRQESTKGTIYSPLLPSVVAEVSPGVWQVGQGAKEARIRGLLRGRQIFYSTKSEMGLGREPYYPFATRELDTPYKVAGRLLAELRGAVEEEAGPQALETAIVTVPASFQLSARKDTFRAAGLAGLALTERSLLDEPNAALLDYLLTCRPRSGGGASFDFSAPRVVLVFDFGGGTCDVSILRVHADGPRERLDIVNLAIARYGQLGGDNIDAAIVEHVLLPQLLKQNGLEALDLSWSEKKDRILPQLLSTAEALKLAVCAKYRSQLGVGPDPRIDRKLAVAEPSLQVELPARAGAPLRTLVLERPSLTLGQLEGTLEPFLDADCLYPRDTEMNAVSSVFAPVGDALRRAELEKGDIDAVLLVGGSSLMPQVQRALARHFQRATLLLFPDDEHAISAVARGAALHSLFLHTMGRPLLKPIAQESLGILTRQGGFVELIPRGSELPFPANGDPAQFRGLVVPQDLMKEVQIVVAAEGPAKVLGVEHLQIPELRSAGAPIDVRFRLDANKILVVEASLADHPDARCAVTLENPLCAASFRSERHQRILELEERVGRGLALGGNEAHVVDATEELASLHLEDQKYEKAIDSARAGMELEGRSRTSMLTVIAIAYEKLGALDRAEKHYREASKTDPGTASLRYNLSLLLERTGRSEEALELAREAVRLAPTEGAYQGQLGDVLRRLGRGAEATTAFRRAVALLDAVPTPTAFQKTWRRSVAEALGDSATLARLRKLEPTGPVNVQYDEDKLPAQSAALARRA